jgi:hypothetical protein
VYTFYLFVYTSTCYTGAYFWVKICTRVACKHVNVGYKTEKFTLLVLHLTVLVRVTVLVR